MVPEADRNALYFYEQATPAERSVRRAEKPAKQVRY
jgi:hypothetical protein